MHIDKSKECPPARVGRVDPILKSEYLTTYRASNQKRYGQAFMRNPERERGEREREGRFDEHDELFMGLMGIQ